MQRLGDCVFQWSVCYKATCETCGGSSQRLRLPGAAAAQPAPICQVVPGNVRTRRLVVTALAAVTFTFGQVLKVDSTKVCKKLQGASINNVLE